MTRTASWKLIALVASVGALAGCVSPAPVLDSQLGSAVLAARAQQTLNPDAARNAAPPVLDGQAANDAIDRYHDSFKAPPAPVNVFTIGIGAGS